MFRHELPFDRSSLTRWRERLGEEQIAALLQESLSVAYRIERHAWPGADSSGAAQRPLAWPELHQLLDRAMGEPGIGRMRDRLLLDSGIYRNPFEIFGVDRPRLFRSSERGDWHARGGPARR